MTGAGETEKQEQVKGGKRSKGSVGSTIKGSGSGKSRPSGRMKMMLTETKVQLGERRASEQKMAETRRIVLE